MNKCNNKRPPKLIDCFLEFYCKPELLEQIQGDVHELFYWRMDEKNEAYARRAFIWDVIRFFRWRNIKKTGQQQNSIAMFKNYMKIGWRNILNQKTPSFINIFGLASAIACCLVAYLFISSVWLRGNSHKNKEEIYLVTQTTQVTDFEQRSGSIANPISQEVQQTFSQVKSTVRVNRSSVVIKTKGDTFSELGQFVDPEFINMFTYDIKYGSKETINDAKQVLITEHVANKLFGVEYPIDQELQININNELHTFKVGGVIKNLPSNAMFRFGILINYEILKLSNSNLTLDQKWESTSWLFVQIDKDKAIDKVESDFNKLISIQNSAVPDHKYLRIELLPFTDIISNAQSMVNGPGEYGSSAPFLLLAIIALFMLSLAIFNYINIAILMATRRIKEIGIRKVIGGRKGQLVFQFLSENMITCFLAIVLGALIAYTFFLPWFNDISGKNLHINLTGNWHLWAFFGFLLFFITLLSGSYPAFYIASFKPVHIFRGKQKIGSKGKFTSVLLTFQFVLAIVTIVAGLAFLHANKSNESRDWGYNPQSKIYVNIQSNEDFTRINNQLALQPDVLNTSGSVEHVGKELINGEARINNEDFEVKLIHAQPNYAEVIGLRLKQGRFMDPHSQTDLLTGAIVNQTFLDWFEIPFPTDNKMTIDSIDYDIIGVVEDYHYYPFAFTIVPTVILAMPDSNYNFLSIEVRKGSEKKMSAKVKEIWMNQVENGLYEGNQQAAAFEQFYDDMDGVRNILLFTASLAIVLSAMGLFGLVSLNITAKIKDFGIRKVMGANLNHLSKLVYKRYLILWLIGSVFGGVLATLAINQMLDMIYAYHPPVGFLPLMAAVTLLLIVIIITVGLQLIKVKKTNPIDILRME